MPPEYSFSSAQKYMVSIVEPIKDGRRMPLCVQVYERLDLNPDHCVGGSSVEHVRFIGDFPLHEGHEGEHRLDLDEIVQRVMAMTQPPIE